MTTEMNIIEPESRGVGEPATKSPFHRLTASPFLLLVAFALALFVHPAHASDALTPGVLINSGNTATNNWMAATNGIVWRQVLVFNGNATDYWILLFDSRTNKLVNATVEHSPVKVLAGTTAYIAPPGGPLLFNRGLNIAVSTTPNTLTNAIGVSNFVFTVYRNP